MDELHLGMTSAELTTVLVASITVFGAIVSSLLAFLTIMVSRTQRVVTRNAESLSVVHKAVNGERAAMIAEVSSLRDALSRLTVKDAVLVEQSRIADHNVTISNQVLWDKLREIEAMLPPTTKET